MTLQRCLLLCPDLEYITHYLLQNSQLGSPPTFCWRPESTVFPQKLRPHRPRHVTYQCHQLRKISMSTLPPLLPLLLLLFLFNCAPLSMSLSDSVPSSSLPHATTALIGSIPSSLPLFGSNTYPRSCDGGTTNSTYLSVTTPSTLSSSLPDRLKNGTFCQLMMAALVDIV